MSLGKKRNTEMYYKAAKLMVRPQGATNKQLQEELNCSIETVHRLKRDMEDAGWPLSDNGGIRDSRNRKVFTLDQEYFSRVGSGVIPNVELSDEELIALHMLQGEESILTGTPFIRHLKKAFFKLGQSLCSGENQFVGRIQDLMLSSGFLGKDYTKKGTVLQTLIKSIVQCKTCIVRYHAFHDGTEKTYRVDPLHLVEHNGGLYVFAKIPRYEEVRVLAVDRIRSIKQTEDTFNYPEEFDAKAKLGESFGLTFDDPVKATVWISSEQAKYVKERKFSSGTQLVDQGDGSLILEFDTSGRAELKQWVLSMGRHAEVVGPQELREEIRLDIEEMSKRYA